MNDLTPFGIDSWPRDILVWHTKTLVDVRTTKTYGYNVEVPSGPLLLRQAVQKPLKSKLRANIEHEDEDISR